MMWVYVYASGAAGVEGSVIGGFASGRVDGVDVETSTVAGFVASESWCDRVDVFRAKLMSYTHSFQ